MANFPSIAPTFNAVKSSQPAIKTTKFGDGYEQRTTFGLNQNPKEWSLTFMVNATDSATIEDFLDAMAEKYEDCVIEASMRMFGRSTVVNSNLMSLIGEN